MENRVIGVSFTSTFQLQRLNSGGTSYFLVIRVFRGLERAAAMQHGICLRSRITTRGGNTAIQEMHLLALTARTLRRIFSLHIVYNMLIAIGRPSISQLWRARNRRENNAPALDG